MDFISDIGQIIIIKHAEIQRDYIFSYTGKNEHLFRYNFSWTQLMNNFLNVLGMCLTLDKWTATTVTEGFGKD